MTTVLAVVGSPRKQGLSSQLADSALEGAKEKDAETRKIFLDDFNLDACRDCVELGCYREKKCNYDDDFEKVSASETSLLLSFDCGQKAVDYLTTEFGIEQICKDIPLPVGFGNTRRWLTEMGERFGAREVADKLIAEGEKRVVEVCRRKGLEQFFMHRAPSAIVTDATIGVPLVRFISEDLEMLPELICLRSSQEKTREILEKEIKELSLNPRVIYGADVYQSSKALAESSPEVVFGSNVEKHAIEELDIPFIFLIASPTMRFRMIDREYFGYTGMLNLIEFIQNDWRERYRSRQHRYQARW